MELCSILIFIITVSSKKIVLFRKFVSITNVFYVVVSTRIIKMVYLNSRSARSLKWPVPWCFTRLFTGKVPLAKNCVPWLIFMSPISKITFPIPRTLCLFISSLKLNSPVTSLNLFTCEVVLSMYWIPLFIKVVNSQNGSHNLVAGYLLDSVQKSNLCLSYHQPRDWPYLSTIRCDIMIT